MQRDVGVAIWDDDERTHTVHTSMKAGRTMENLQKWFLPFSPVESTEPADL